MPLNPYELRQLIEMAYGGYMKYKVVTNDYTLSPEDHVLFVDTSSGDVTIQTYNTNNISDGYLHTHYIYKMSQANVLTVLPPSGQTFKRGCTKLISTNVNETIYIGGYHGSLWSSIGRTLTAIVLGRLADWDASNFTSFTPVPWDTLLKNDNDSVFQWSASTPTDVKILIAGSYKINYMVATNSTGGSTYTCRAYITQNGTKINQSRTRTGNYGNEDQSSTSLHFEIDCNVNDIIQLKIDNNALTGNLEYAYLTIETRL